MDVVEDPATKGAAGRGFAGRNRASFCGDGDRGDHEPATEAERSGTAGDQSTHRGSRAAGGLRRARIADPAEAETGSSVTAVAPIRERSKFLAQRLISLSRFKGLTRLNNQEQQGRNGGLPLSGSLDEKMPRSYQRETRAAKTPDFGVLSCVKLLTSVRMRAPLPHI